MRFSFPWTRPRPIKATDVSDYSMEISSTDGDLTEDLIRDLMKIFRDAHLSIHLEHMNGTECPDCQSVGYGRVFIGGKRVDMWACDRSRKSFEKEILDLREEVFRLKRSLEALSYDSILPD